MDKEYIEEQQFKQLDFSKQPFAVAEYESCQFLGCNFSNVDLSKINFSGCEFIGCNLSMATLVKTGFTATTFKDCKLLGLHFDHCNEFRLDVRFDQCVLNLSSFYKRKMKKANFLNCSLQEVDFAEADFSSAKFSNCDLARATFDNTILEKADFTTAYNYSIDPGRNKLRKAIFGKDGLAGLLHQYELVIV